jgi:hypothetical protein
VQIKHTDISRTNPIATVLFGLGTAATLAMVAPVHAESKNALTPAGKPKDRQGAAIAAAALMPPDLCAAGSFEYDCNQNGIHDLCDIADGWADANEDGILDHCQFAAGDLDLDGFVGPFDLALILGNWEAEGHDVNGDGIANGIDLAILLSNWSTGG